MSKRAETAPAAGGGAGIAVTTKETPLVIKKATRNGSDAQRSPVIDGEAALVGRPTGAGAGVR